MATAARPSLTATIASHPITAYVLIAYAVSWILTLLLSVSLVFGLLALAGPTIAAVVVTRSEGSFAELRERITAWRRPIVWYALAFGIPFVVAGIARLLLSLAGQAPDGIGAISAIELVLFVLIIGEEIGWRGFLQPKLRAAGMGLAVAGLITGSSGPSGTSCCTARRVPCSSCSSRHGSYPSRSRWGSSLRAPASASSLLS